MQSTGKTKLSAVVVHWRDEEHLDELVASWPDTPDFELLVVDNSASLGELPQPARLLTPGHNLGFAGGVNHGAAVASGEVLLILNADALPQPGALECLLAAFEGFPQAAGIVPALEGPGGESQHRWQLQPLPTPFDLLRQTFFFAATRGPLRPPARGTAIAQPAAAALALRVDVLRQVGGFDEGFFPAWFEDVDLARRLADQGHQLHYDPTARFSHAGGATVGRLGYGPFLWVYYRGLVRYLTKHHGGGWALLARVCLPLGMLWRTLLLARRPRRAASRREAAAGLWAVAAGAASGWRRPLEYARRFSARAPG
ncbi:MAG: glycosyltransferase family 2 protein [Acidobacteriota bacterium]